MSSTEWHAYFLANARRQREILWELGPGVSVFDLDRIAGSLRGWQRGETSDGSHLLAAARDYAEKMRDPMFIEAVQLFIAEEQRHGEMLGRFLELAGVSRAQFDWGDALFRRIRYCLANMEVWATPVVMVETHALIYYAAIRRATRSVVLREICRQILSDEVAHIRFQCERLAILHRTRLRSMTLATMLFQRALFAGITLAVWVGHRSALRAGGLSFRRFWRSAWAKMNSAFRMMASDSYGWLISGMPDGNADELKISPSAHRAVRLHATPEL